MLQILLVSIPHLLECFVKTLAFRECENILKYRKNWTDEFAHKNFEATVRFVRGAMAIVSEVSEITTCLS